MPQIDISVALTNPYTLDVFSVSRRSEALSITGRSQVTTTLFTGVPGVVYPEGSANLERREMGSIQNKDIAVVTGAFPLRSQSVDTAGQSWQPDIVIWHNNNYLVDNLEDFSAYRLGFIKARCHIWDSMPTPETFSVVALGGVVISHGLLTVTIVNPTTLTLNPIPAAASLFLFKNGQKLSASNNDYTLKGNTVTLTIALLGTDFVEAYA